MGVKVVVAVLFLALTVGTFGLWRWTSSDFWGGIFGNMLVGAITLICVDMIVDIAIQRQTAPARGSAQDASEQVYSQGIRMAFDLYGATVLSGNITEAEHKQLAATRNLKGMSPYLAKTPLRTVAFNSPEQPAILYLYQDAVSIQQSINLVLATQGQYLDPALASALYRLGQSQLITFTISSIQIKAVPERFEQSMFDEYFERLAELRAAIIASDDKASDKIDKFSAFQLFNQPGLFRQPNIAPPPTKP